MGRPALNMARIEVRLPVSICERIDAVAGTYQRAEFIREAVERELARREAEKA